MKDRIKKIKEIILNQKQVEVTTLSELLEVSDVTIRRDLDKLEKEGFLKKTYGGAILLDQFDTNNLFLELYNKSDGVLLDEQRSIAQIVINLLNDGEAIYLGSGPTCLSIARYIKNSEKKLTVLTNDILVAVELFNKNTVNVVMTGGEIISVSPVMVGSLSKDAVKKFFLQKAFIEVHGVDLKFGYSLNSLAEVEFVNNMLDYCKEAYIIADHTIFNKVAFSPLGKLSSFKKVVSNIKIPEEYKDYYFQNDITLFNSCDFS